MRVVIVPSTLALLPAYASIEDPIADLRKTVDDAVAWLVEDGPAAILGEAAAADRIGAALLGERSGSGPGLLVVANGSATRTERAPGHFDDRAATFDTALGAALEAGDTTALADLDLALAHELWSPDAATFVALAAHVGDATIEATLDYDDAPYGVQYWVVRWQCAS